MSAPSFPPQRQDRTLLPIEKCTNFTSTSPYGKAIVELLCKGNLPQAEVQLRNCPKDALSEAQVLNFLGWIAAAIELPAFARRYFMGAVECAPDWKLAQINLNSINQLLGDFQTSTSAAADGNPQHRRGGEKFLLIKAWGYGFWSDVSHVLGQLLLAELTNRIPVVHWGSNSLFGDVPGQNSFDHFFEPLSDQTIEDLRNEDLSFWPPKWRHDNLTENDLNKWTGPFSRMSGIYFFARQETVLVSDFFTSVLELVPWIPAESPLSGLSVDALWVYLVHKYLRPKKEILDVVNDFHEKNIGASEFMSVHARGSDKILEMGNLEQLNMQYKRLLDVSLAGRDYKRIFLMTDDSRLRNYFLSLYGDKIVFTNCLRTNSSQGVHYQTYHNRRQLGIEVMVDAYLAAKADIFIGNGFSNPSLFVSYLKPGPREKINLIGPNMHQQPDTFLHNW